jgi:hypothetical protein
VDKVGKFTQRIVNELRARLATMQPKADKAAQTEGQTTEKATLMEVCHHLVITVIRHRHSSTRQDIFRQSPHHIITSGPVKKEQSNFNFNGH